MNYICIGTFVNTHGIKGEIRIISDFKFKNEVFKIGKKVYLGKEKKELTIKTYRIHKNYDMLTFENINNIDDVLKYKGENVYTSKDDLNIDGYLDEELIGFDVMQNNKKIGKVTNLKLNKQYTLIVVLVNNKEYLIPNIPEFVLNVDLQNKYIDIVDMKGLVDEN